MNKLTTVAGIKPDSTCGFLAFLSLLLCLGCALAYSSMGVVWFAWFHLIPVSVLIFALYASRFYWLGRNQVAVLSFRGEEHTDTRTGLRCTAPFVKVEKITRRPCTIRREPDFGASDDSELVMA